MRWAVHGLIPMDAVAVLYGAAYTGKTGLTVHLVSCLVSGSKFFGRDVEPMAVCYLALENVLDVKAHILAVQKERDPGWTWPRLLAISDKNVDLGRRVDADSIVADIHRMTGGAPAVLIVDALLDVIGDRDITSNAELGPVMRNVHAIAQGIHGPVVIVHHSNRTAEKAVLGASVILTRADVHLRVEAAKKGSIWMAEKVKGGTKTGPHAFGFRPVLLGQNSSGQEVSSCVVVEQGPAKATTKPKDAGSTMQKQSSTASPALESESARLPRRL